MTTIIIKTDDNVFIEAVCGLASQYDVDISVPLKKSQKQRLTHQIIAAEVCEFYNETLESVCEKSRKLEVLRPRQVIHFLCKTRLGMPFALVANIYGGLKHAACMHSKKVVQNLIDTDREFRDDIQKLKDILSNYSSD